IDEIIYHTKAVKNGAKNALIVSDMPFLSYHVSIEDAVKNAGRLVKEGGAHAVKLEGGANVIKQIESIVNAQIPVMGHLGLTPQSVNSFGGFKVQG
ncbi:ketopantoate hydroxymethyltransferase family protein, partial [Clostridioides difficile DA00215]